MTKKVTAHMRKAIYPWVKEHIDPTESAIFPDAKKFWTIPFDEKTHPDYKNAITLLIDKFECTQIVTSRKIEGIGVVVLSVAANSTDDYKRVFICGAYLNGQRVLNPSENIVDDIKLSSDLTFLQKFLAISELKITAKSIIPSNIWNQLPIFEDDIEPYLPSLVCFEATEDLLEEPPNALILRFLLSLDVVSPAISENREELVEVALAMPQADHEWLLNQLMYSVLSGRETSFFSELYKIVEFFFPLHKIGKLRTSLGYEGSTLKLLEICRTDLGWHVNHQHGSRLALNFPGISFAEITLSKQYEGRNADDERKFKEAAMEKITDFRHELIHQNFKPTEIVTADLTRLIKALLSFLKTSFVAYSTTHLAAFEGE